MLDAYCEGGWLQELSAQMLGTRLFYQAHLSAYTARLSSQGRLVLSIHIGCPDLAPSGPTWGQRP